VNNPLQNRKILITRDQRQGEEMIREIRELGGEVISFPTIKITDPQDLSASIRAIEDLNRYDWIIFTSSNGVHYFFKRLRDTGKLPSTLSIACVGKKTAIVLESYGYNADLIPEKYNAKALLKAFSEEYVSGKKILWPTSNLSSDELSAGLKKLGALIDKVVFYNTHSIRHENSNDQLVDLNKDRIDCLAFFSPSQFKSFIRITGLEKENKTSINKYAIAAIGPSTARAIKKRGFNVDIQPDESVTESLVEAIAAYFKQKQNA
jgi:uroporphyrinogen III methyltransferase/synthase